nr:hypothetical protein [Casimicrobium sp.]
MKRALNISVSVMLCALLTACANFSTGKKAEDEAPQTTTQANSEDPLRYRARVHTELAANYFQRGQMAVALEE